MIRRLSEIGIVILTIAYQFFYCDQGDTRVDTIPTAQPMECSNLRIKGVYKLDGKILGMEELNNFQEEIQFDGEKGVTGSASYEISGIRYDVQNTGGTYVLNQNCTGTIYWKYGDKSTVQFATDPLATHIYVATYNSEQNSTYVIPLIAIR